MPLQEFGCLFLAEASRELSLLLQLFLFQDCFLLLLKLYHMFLFSRLGISFPVEHCLLFLSELLKSCLPCRFNSCQLLLFILVGLLLELAKLLVDILLLLLEVLRHRALVCMEALELLQSSAPFNMLLLLEFSFQGCLLLQSQALNFILKTLFSLSILNLDVHLAITLFFRKLLESRLIVICCNQAFALLVFQEGILRFKLCSNELIFSLLLSHHLKEHLLEHL